MGHHQIVTTILCLLADIIFIYLQWKLEKISKQLSEYNQVPKRCR